MVEQEFNRAAAEARALGGGTHEDGVAPGTAEAEPEREAAIGSAVLPLPPPEEAAKKTASLFVAEFIPFGALAQFRGEHWRVNEAEIKTLAPLWAETLDKYWPNWYKVGGPEIRLGIMLLMMIKARMDLERLKLAEQNKSAATATAGGDATGGGAAPPSPPPGLRTFDGGPSA